MTRRLLLALAMVLSSRPSGVVGQVLGRLSTEYAPISWKVTVPGDIETQPVLSDDESTLFVCFNGPIANSAGVTNMTGQLVALDASSGSERWRFLNPYLQPFMVNGECPVKKGAAGTLVVVSNSVDVRERMMLEVSMSGAWLKSSSPQNQSNPVAFMDYHGHTTLPCEYRYPDDDERRGSTCDYPFPVASPPAHSAATDTIFVPSADRHLLAVSTTTGSLLPFISKCPEANYISRYQADGSLDLNADPMRNAMSSDCRTLLTYNSSVDVAAFGLPVLTPVSCPWLTVCSTIALQPVLIGGGATVLTLSTDGLVLAVDTATRAAAWERRLRGIPTQVPVLTRQGAILLHAEGEVHMYWPNGTDVWTAPFRAPNTTVVVNGTVLFDRPAVTRVFHSPHAENDRVYVQDDAHWLYALDHATGAVVWQYRVGERVYEIPVKGPTTAKVFVTSLPGDVFALDCAPGRQFVLDRVVYRCADLGVLIPTQRDLCEELEHKCPPAE